MALPPPLPRAPHPALRIGLTIFACVLALICFLGIWYAKACNSERKIVSNLETEAAKRGEPLTLSAMAAMYPKIPDDQNSAQPLLAVWKDEDPEYWTAIVSGKHPLVLRVNKKYDRNLPYVGSRGVNFERAETLSAENRLACDKFINSQRDHFAALRTAFQRPKSRFPILIEEGFAALLPHISAVKEEATGLRVRLLRAADENRPRDAITGCEDILRVANLLTNEPITVSQLACASICRMAIDSVEDLVSRKQLSAPQLRSLRAPLERIDARAMLRMSLLCERATDLSVFDRSEQLIAVVFQEDARAEENRIANFRKGMQVLTALGFTVRDRRLILETVGNMLDASEEEWPVVSSETREIRANMEHELVSFPPKMFAKMLLPPMNNLASRFIALEARKRASLAALAVEEYRAAHGGALPSNLSLLVPNILSEVPADPFDGQPVRFRTSKSGYVVYSIGPDLSDDGGTKSRRGIPQVGTDEGFVVGPADEAKAKPKR